MNVKKILVTLLASALLLSSCGSKNDNSLGDAVSDGINDVENAVTDVIEGNGSAEENNSNEEGNNGSTADENTSGDTSGKDENAGGDTAASGEGTIQSADDVISFLDNDVYPQCPADSLPMMLMSTALPMDDMEGVTYHTGLADVNGITDIILSESGVGSIAYSLVYLRTDGTATADIQQTLGESINPRKWVCVGAEYIASVTLDNDVVLIMGSKDQVDMVMNAVITAAEGKFTNIGSVVTFG